MLVATREPSVPQGAHAAPAKPTGIARLMSLFQLAGSILAVPVGLASAYSLYHSTFSDEARCQSLRASIISMLDKSADASTLRVLVRRDVLAFEQSCASVDADAVKAFKTLLAEKPAVPAPAVAVVPPPHETHQAKAPPVKAQPAPPKPNVTARTAERPVEAERKPVRADTAAADAKWLEAVRGALVAHRPETQPAEETAAVPAMPRVVQPQPVVPKEPVNLVPPQAEPVVAPPAAPALPPPSAVANAPSVKVEAPPDHPVPPGTIPDASPVAPAADAAQAGSRFGWVGKIPLVGRWVGQ